MVIFAAALSLLLFLWVRPRDNTLRRCDDCKLAVPAASLPVIIDGDSGNDVAIDDGFSFAARLQQLGYMKILAATVSSSADSIPRGGDYVRAHFEWAGLDVPIGTFKGKFLIGEQYEDHNYCEYIQGSNRRNWFCRGEMPEKLGVKGDYRDAAKILRGALESASDNSVVMIELGMSQNFAVLLKNESDVELVRRKVRYLVQMGGRYPSSCCEPDKIEWNFKHTPAEAALISEKWPTQIYYVGYEVGYPGPVFGAGSLELPPKHPLRVAHETFGSETRYGWDVMTVLFPVLGTAGGYFELSGYGENRIDQRAGANTFTISRPGPTRQFVLKARRDIDFQNLVDPILVR